MRKLPHTLLFLIQSRAFWWTLFVCWVGTEFVLSSIPGKDMPDVGIVNFDKVEHMACFAAGALALTLALGATFPRWSWPKRIAPAVAAVSLYGWLDEWHQTFTPGRSGNDVYDWLSDTIGALIGALAAYTIATYAGNLPSFRRETARRGTHQDPAA